VSTQAALTLIAISLMLIAVMSIIGTVILWLLAKRLMKMERTVGNQIETLRAEIQGAIRQARDTSRDISETLSHLRRGAYNVGLIVSGLTSWAVTRRRLMQKDPQDKTSLPWWLQGVATAWTLFQRTRQKKSMDKSSQKSSGM
jgi:uncharacterized protein YoxC